ncbi:hypothetical protein PRIPAC_95372, partial [Pristionchus pacificus]|uniref:Uncharacterized protein n=1 Tax=Pristionchus pacificus TaxID=54126 RepID=A0A2A6D2G0_PRIPA
KYKWQFLSLFTSFSSKLLGWYHRVQIPSFSYCYFTETLSHSAITDGHGHFAPAFVVYSYKQTKDIKTNITIQMFAIFDNGFIYYGDASEKVTMGMSKRFKGYLAEYEQRPIKSDVNAGALEYIVIVNLLTKIRTSIKQRFSSLSLVLLLVAMQM